MTFEYDHESDLSILEERLGYEFDDRALLVRALTHRSFTNEREAVEEDNQRLEFLGDAVLGVVTAEELFRRFPDMAEGALSTCQAQIICETGLFDVAKELDLGNFLRLGKGEILYGGREKPSVLAYAYEAVLAAIHLDGGLERARDVILRLHETALGACKPLEPSADYKSRLQHIVQSERGDRPEYTIVEERGPAHERVFVAEVQIDGQPVARGEGRSKKEAEQQAAFGALEHLDTSVN